eukprot:2763889-Rhodomonas_salina.2
MLPGPKDVVLPVQLVLAPPIVLEDRRTVWNTDISYHAVRCAASTQAVPELHTRASSDLYIDAPGCFR